MFRAEGRAGHAQTRRIAITLVVGCCGLVAASSRAEDVDLSSAGELRQVVLFGEEGDAAQARAGDVRAVLRRKMILHLDADPQNVSIDHESAQIRLSAIFEMYRSDFTRDLTRRGLTSDRGVIDYVASVAPDALRAELQQAADYEVVFMDYDWAIAAH